VRTLAERTRDLAERIDQKLAIRRRLRGAAKTLTGAARRTAFGGDTDRRPLDEFLAWLAGRPEAALWAVYTTDPYSEQRGQRSTWIARELLRRGHAVVFFYWRWTTAEPVAISPSPGLLPVPIDTLPAIWPTLAALPRAQKLLLIEFPDRALFELVGLANAHGFVTVYDCVDDWEEFARLGQALWYDDGVERFLASQCDVVVATHPLLCAKLAGLGARAPALVPNGFDPASLAPRDRSGRPPPPEKRVGYFGHLTDAWFDWDLVRATARRRSDLRFEVIGYGEPRDLDLPENVRLLGAVPHERLAEHARDWAVGVVPFREGPLVRAVDPIKVYEYLALGLPVVAVGMPHLEGTPGVFVCGSAGFEAALDAAVRTPFDERAVAAFLRESGWSARVDRLLERIAAVPPHRDVLKVLAG
jgi:glycosyltransferase involved in cell wall biosynthesis